MEIYEFKAQCLHFSGMFQTSPLDSSSTFVESWACLIWRNLRLSYAVSYAELAVSQIYQHRRWERYGSMLLSEGNNVRMKFKFVSDSSKSKSSVIQVLCQCILRLKSKVSVIIFCENFVCYRYLLNDETIQCPSTICSVVADN